MYSSAFRQTPPYASSQVMVKKERATQQNAQWWRPSVIFQPATWTRCGGPRAAAGRDVTTACRDLPNLTDRACCSDAHKRKSLFAANGIFDVFFPTSSSSTSFFKNTFRCICFFRLQLFSKCLTAIYIFSASHRRPSWNLVRNGRKWLNGSPFFSLFLSRLYRITEIFVSHANELVSYDWNAQRKCLLQFEKKMNGGTDIQIFN